jgi:hypothetical protein
MITTDNIRTINVPEMTADVLSSGAEKLTQIQLDVLNRTYVKDTGDLAGNLSSKPFSVRTINNDVSLEIRYMFYLRFLDLKYSSKGKKKKRYAPIYNKYVYGFMMGYIYNNLRMGLSAVVVRELPVTVLNVNI